MGTVKKFLLGAFGLAVTVALIYTGVRVFSKATDMADGIAESQDETGRTVSEYAVMRYDGYEISGSTAISYIKTVVSKYEIPVDVTTTSGMFICNDRSMFADFRDISSAYYIDPMKQYLVTVVRDANDVLSKVVIAYVP